MSTASVGEVSGHDFFEDGLDEAFVDVDLEGVGDRQDGEIRVREVGEGADRAGIAADAHDGDERRVVGTPVVEDAAAPVLGPDDDAEADAVGRYLEAAV